MVIKVMVIKEMVIKEMVNDHWSSRLWSTRRRSSRPRTWMLSKRLLVECLSSRLQWYSPLAWMKSYPQYSHSSFLWNPDNIFNLSSRSYFPPSPSSSTTPSSIYVMYTIPISITITITITINTTITCMPSHQKEEVPHLEICALKVNNINKTWKN